MHSTKHQSGFSLIILPILLVVIVAIAAGGWFVLSKQSDTKDQDGSNKNSSQASNTEPSAEPDLVLQNFGLINLSDNAVDTQAVREFKTAGLKGFYVFGDTLSGNRRNPNFEFASMRKDADVIAAIDGIVTHIQKQEDTNDYEVFLQPKEGSMWTVGYDHITNVKVTKGSSIKAGDVIGNAAVQNNGLYRFELQINKNEGSTTTHFCPSSLLAQDKISTLTELTAMMASWESTTGLELYNQPGQNPAGCIVPTLSVAEAEGR